MLFIFGFSFSLCSIFLLLISLYFYSFLIVINITYIILRVVIIITNVMFHHHHFFLYLHFNLHLCIFSLCSPTIINLYSPSSCLSSFLIHSSHLLLIVCFSVTSFTFNFSIHVILHWKRKRKNREKRKKCGDYSKKTAKPRRILASNLKQNFLLQVDRKEASWRAATMMIYRLELLIQVIF